MGKLLEGNGMWESSRFILPEHREAIINHAKEKGRKERRLLDEQELGLFSRILQESQNRRIAIQISMYDEYENLKVYGVVEAISTSKGMFKVNDDWFDLEDIDGISDID